MKALVGAFNKEKVLVEAFSVIVKTSRASRIPVTSEGSFYRHEMALVVATAAARRHQNVLITTIDV